MKKAVLFFLFSLFFLANANSQTDKALQERIDAVLKVTQDQDLEKILDYTYPKLFTIATREQMAQALKDAFESDEFTVTFDSVKLVKVFPVFTMQKGQYAKMKHTIIMRMKFTEQLENAEADTMLVQMAEEFGKGNLRFDKATNTMNIYMRSEMVAVKDEFSKEWSFVNYSDDDEIISLLFSKEVIAKLKEYN